MMRRQTKSDSDSDSSEEEVVNFKRCKRSTEQRSVSSLVQEDTDIPNAKLEPAGAKPVSVLPSEVVQMSNPDHSDHGNPQRFQINGPPFNQHWWETCYDKFSDDEDGSAPRLNIRPGTADELKRMGVGKGIPSSKVSSEKVSEKKLSQIQELLSGAGIVIDSAYFNFKEEVCVKEELEWLTGDHSKPLYDYPAIVDWRKVGPRKTGISGEVDFIGWDLLHRLLIFKKCRDLLTRPEREQIRIRCNPFEGLGKGPFVSRGGMKLANLDAILSFALTQPNQDLKPDKELFYFADICAGFGGFAEYILFKRNWDAKGFGIGTKFGGIEFCADSFKMGSPESYEYFYGPSKNGDICDHANTTDFINLVRSSTHGREIDLMLADGAFVCENRELEEILHAQMYLSECMLALTLVKTGGIFVCKFFDTLTPFTVGLIYLMYCSFESVAIHKPNSSRPDSSERYLICKGKKTGTDGILAYLTSCHSLLWSWSQEAGGSYWLEDVVELVPFDVLKQDKKFFNYIVETNSRIARKQIKALELMFACAKDPSLMDGRKDWIAKKCFDYWQIPSVCKENSSIDANKFCKQLLATQSGEFLRSQSHVLNEENMETLIMSPFDWRMVVVEADAQESIRGFYLAMGLNQIYRLNGENWLLTKEKMELSKETLVYGEFVTEIHGENESQQLQRAFYIIDAMILGGRDIAALHYMQRYEVCAKFAKSMNKLSKPELCAIRVKPPVRTENIADIFSRLERRQVIGSEGSGAHLVSPVELHNSSAPVIKPAGILFLKITKDPWTMALSRKAKRKYYFNVASGASDFNVPAEAVSGFKYTMQHRIEWMWDDEVKAILEWMRDEDIKTIFANQNAMAETCYIDTSPEILDPLKVLRHVGRFVQSN